MSIPLKRVRIINHQNSIHLANPAVKPTGTRHLRGITHRELDDTQPDHQFVRHVPDDSFHDDLFL